MLSKLIAGAFVLLLVAGVPLLSLATARRTQIRHVPRLSLYFSAVISQWLLAGIGMVVVLLTRAHCSPSFSAPFLFLWSLAGLLSWLVSRWPAW